MNIVLLSGGSGKRLWPLSNDVRSKQFIKLFRLSDGSYESMVQRVYRQIRETDPDASVTIATAKSQVSAIRNQLGEHVSVCIEPVRRDTFPAIALASAFLHDRLHVGGEEPVVVCPVDPYVDDAYFEKLKELSDYAAKGGACLTLMGIEPTYPSEKYGYIIPETKDEVSMVREFREKPDLETAENYIKRGGLWNAGVFAFKLSYLLEKAHSLIDFRDYEDLFAKYAALTKISFDYAVAEKEKSIRVLRYAGEWKDVGTWNTMSEVMTERAKGNAIFDDACENVNVVNELDMPILVCGAKNMVIAASGDGILVADKHQSAYMKPYVEKISEPVHFAEKSWGSYTVIDAGCGYLNVKVDLRPGNRMTYHSHEYRREVWTVLSGTGTAVVDGVKTQIGPGDVVKMPAGAKHTVIAESEMIILECQIGENISVKDKTKYPYEGVIDPGIAKADRE